MALHHLVWPAVALILLFFARFPLKTLVFAAHGREQHRAALSRAPGVAHFVRAHEYGHWLADLFHTVLALPPSAQLGQEL